MMHYSFVIPSYNHTNLLQNTLEALNNQRAEFHDMYEVIVVDDGSYVNIYDHIRDIPLNYHLHYHYLKRDKTSCRARARNTGWKNASGKIVIFIDADILVNEDYLYELAKCFKYGENVLVAGTRIMVPDTVDRNDIQTKKVFEKYRFDGTNPALWEMRHRVFDFLSYNINCYQFPWFFAHSANMAVSKQWLEYTGGFDEGFKGWGHEDIELGYRLHQAGVKIILNRNLEVWHQNHDSAARDTSVEEFIRDIEPNCRYFLGKYPGLFDLPYEEALEVLKGNKIIDIRNKSHGFLLDHKTGSHNIDFKNLCEIETAKKEIKDLSSRSMDEIIIHDYTENSDLHLWVQFISVDKNIPEYFPVSKRLINNKPIERIR